MKEIKINKLTIRNFKGCAALDLELGGKNAGIYGDNATGKTTVYDAVTWLLFGRDSRGGSDQEIIKPLDKDGNVKDHEAVTCVEAELTVCEDSRQATVTLRKEMQESWVTRRGSSKAVYDGNEFRYAIDGVPMKKNEFQRRVGELVDEDSFRMLTSVTAFAQDLPWRKRREILYEISGVSDLSDRALLQQMAKEASNGGLIARAADAVDGETLEELSEMLSGKTLEDLQKVLGVKRKALMGTRSQTPARLDELNRQAAPLEARDYGSVETEKTSLEQELEQIRTEKAKLETENGITKQSEAERKLQALEAERKVENAKLAEQRAGIRQRISDLEYEQAQWSSKNTDKLNATRQKLDGLYSENRSYRWKQEMALPDLKSLKQKLDALQADAARLKQSAELHEKDAAAREAQLEQDRKDWLAVNEESFGGAKCPTCGQELPMDQMQKARDSFEDNKAKRLGGIREMADIHKERAETSRANARQDLERLAAVNEALDEAAARLMEAEKQPSEIPDMEGYLEQKEALEAKLAELRGLQFMPGYREKHDALQAELDAVPAEWTEYRQRRQQIDEEIRRENDEKALQDSKREERINALRSREDNVKARLRDTDSILQGKFILAGLRDRINELREEQKRTAEELERVDRLANGVEEFIRWKTRFIEDSVNGLFRIVTFRLFREQANGGLEERCDVVVDGVPYNALNNGTRINAGLDIIRRLAEHYDVRVPLFVDNAEGVTRLEDAGTQVIRLVVSEQDKSLRVETAG